MPESQNPMPGPFQFQPGDRVIWVNEYGVYLGIRTVTGCERWERSLRYYLTPMDAPWFPVGEECLRPAPPGAA